MVNVSATAILKIITIIVAVIITIYVFQEHKRWIKFSQGIKPVLVSFGILSIAIILHAMENKIDSLDSFLNLVILTRQTKYSVGIYRIVALSYIVLLYGLEISFIVLFKRYKAK